MTAFDAILVAILLVSFLLGLWRGLVYEVLTLLGWPIAFVVSKMFAADILPYMPEFSEPMLRMVLAYGLIFIGTILLWSIIVYFIGKFIDAVGLSWLDRILGSLFGLLRGVFVIVLAVWLAALTTIPELPFWKNAKTRQFAEDAALYTKTWLPESIAKHIKFGS